MKRVFADSLYWIALAYPRDQWHAQAMKASQSLRSVEIVTTEEVLNEFLTAFRYHSELRRTATKTVEGLLSKAKIRVRPQSHQTFREGFELYERRSDKEYSLTDGISMAAMKEEKIPEILSHDWHFTQEGFTLLL